MLKDFKEFALRGNVVDMAVGIIIGGAFGTIVKSLVSDVIMPPIGILLGGVDFSNICFLLRPGPDNVGPYGTLAEAQEAGAVTINFGVFMDNVVTFVIIAFAVFLLVRAMVNLQRKEEAPPAAPTTQDCPRCRMSIPIEATRCPHCTSEVTAAA